MNANSKITKFKQSRDYRDICYFITHVRDRDVRNSCLEQLGYKIGLNIILSQDNDIPSAVIIGERGEYRVQTSRSFNYIVDCAICEK